MLDIRNTEFIDKAAIKNRAKSIFTTKGAPNVSEKYAHISTEKIIDDMAILGWGVADAKEVKARKKDTVGFQKHLVVFRNNDIQITSEDGDNVFPQILLTNSHDGKNAFTFTAGLFRMICENGLVISSQNFEKMKIRHMGYSFEELQNTIKSIVESLPLTVESLNNFRSVELGQEQMLDFAKKALSARFTDEEINNIEIDIFNDLILQYPAAHYIDWEDMLELPSYITAIKKLAIKLNLILDYAIVEQLWMSWHSETQKVLHE
jgi:hypothetical protein